MSRLTTLGLLVAALSSSSVARSDEGTCRAAFGPEAAKEVFDRLRAHSGADGCSLSDLRTEQSRMRVLWLKHGVPMPEALIEPAGCARAATAAGATLALSSPPELSAACPDALATMTDAVGALHPSTEKQASRPRPTSRSSAVGAWFSVALGLLGAMVVVVAALRRGVPEP